MADDLRKTVFGSRDTQFQGFAKLLYVDIYQRIEHDYGPMHHLIPKVQEAVELIIAQRTYDLALHVVEHCPNDGDYTPPETIISESIPDLTQWPDSPTAE